MFLIQNFKTGLILKLVKIKITLPVLFNIKLKKLFSMENPKYILSIIKQQTMLNHIGQRC